jgi:signal peptidase II
VNRSVRARRVAFVAAACVALDQVTKALARAHLAGTSPQSFLHDTFRLQFAQNRGAFLSFGAALPDDARFWVFTVLNAAFLVGLVAFVLWRRHLAPGTVLGLSLIVAGGLSNLVDRLLNHGAVVDFMNLGIGALRTGVFNVADIAITSGAALIVLAGTYRARSG